MTGEMLGAALLGAAVSPFSHAQELQVGSNAYVDMYFADWHASKVQIAGLVTEYAVVTKGDSMEPTTNGAIRRLRRFVCIRHACSGFYLAVPDSQAARSLLYFRHGHYLCRW
jgi:hypothetical protein